MTDTENLDMSTNERNPSCVTTRNKFVALINIAALRLFPFPKLTQKRLPG